MYKRHILRSQMESYGDMMLKRLILNLLMVGLLATVFSCAETATDQELEKMCQHLAELRGEEKTDSNTKKCVEKAKREGVSKRQALCRISAINKSEYWNRCRVGEARAKKAE